MANKRLYQFLYTKQPKLTMITGAFQTGVSGVVASGSVIGAGVYSVTQLATGTYQIKLVDNYYSYLSAQFQNELAPGAAAVNVSALVGSSAYQIMTVGNSNWTTVGADPDYTPIVGMPFVATAVAGSGTGTAKLLGPSGIDAFEVLSVGNSLMQNLNPNQGRGSSVFFQTLSGTVSSNALQTSTLVASNPTSSSTVTFKLWFKDSSVLAL